MTAPRVLVETDASFSALKMTPFKPSERQRHSAALPNPDQLLLEPLSLLDGLGRKGLISTDSREAAASLYRQTGVHPMPGLLRLNAVAEGQMYREVSQLSGIPVLPAPPAEEAPVLARAVSDGAKELGLTWNWLSEKGLLVFVSDGHWNVAIRDALATDAAQMLQRKLASKLGSAHDAVPVQWSWVTPSVFERVKGALEALESRGHQETSEDLRSLRELAEEGPTIEMVNGILSRAVTQRASDVHFEAEEFEFCVRVRVDGEMLEQTRQPRAKYDAIACRLKILADLDIAERRQAQDGRINARVNGEAFDIRVSVLPAAFGESIVLRLLRQERKPTRLADLGMSAQQAATFDRWVRLSNGIVLVTGPTGSGKSTTLYTAMELANDGSQKIVTIEDPIEYKITGLTQLQVNADIGFTFAAALRSILRHDPDMILVGEIRDEETGRIAIQSALTGHLVLSTLHTNSAIGAITRLIDMGLEPFLIAASLRGLMAQRLVRRLCPHCKVADSDLDEALIGVLKRCDVFDGARPMRPVGCPECSGTGFRGRVAIYDLIEVTAELGHAIAQGQGENELLTLAGAQAHHGLLRSGAEWVSHGETTLSEVLRATGAV